MHPPMLTQVRPPLPVARSRVQGPLTSHLRKSVRRAGVLGSLLAVACGGRVVHDDGGVGAGTGGRAVHDGGAHAGGTGGRAPTGGSGGTGVHDGGTDAGGSGGSANLCPEGSYEVGAVCVPWSACGAGEYMVAAGTATSDRACAPCEAGWFSTSANAEECTPWTACDVVEVEAGTATNDTVCGEWTRQFGTAKFDWAYAVHVGPSGYVYVAGITEGALSGVSAGDEDAYVRKYDSTGTEVWTRQFGTTKTDQAYAVSADASGNVYVAGWTYGGLSGNNVGYADAYVRKYDSAGTVQWTRQFGSGGNDAASAIAVDASGNVYVAGHAQGGLPQPNVGSLDAYVRKYDSAGTEQWTRQVGSVELDSGEAVSVDASGSVYLTGYTEGALSAANAGNEDVFVCKYDSAGTEQWTRQFGSAAKDLGVAVSADANGNAYVAGWTEGALSGKNAGDDDAYIRKYDSGGTEQWTHQFGTAGSDYARALSVDATGSVYVVGATEGALSGTTVDGRDAFARKYDSSGLERWTRQFGTGSTTGKAVSVDANGRPHVAGFTQGTLADVNAGYTDAFVTKLAP